MTEHRRGPYDILKAAHAEAIIATRPERPNRTPGAEALARAQQATERVKAASPTPQPERANMREADKRPKSLEAIAGYMIDKGYWQEKDRSNYVKDQTAKIAAGRGNDVLQDRVARTAWIEKDQLRLAAKEMTLDDAVSRAQKVGHLNEAKAALFVDRQAQLAPKDAEQERQKLAETVLQLEAKQARLNAKPKGRPHED